MHNIEIRDGVAQHVYVGEVPWHGLGRRVPADLAPDQTLKSAGLDWQVYKSPLTTTDPDGNALLVPDRAALIRDVDHSVLDVIGEGWEPLQNDIAFGFFDEFVRAGGMQMHTAGSLKGGRIVWALAKMSESFDVLGLEDRVDSYMLFTNPHSYGQSIDVRFTPIRVVCNNTLAMALRQGSANAVRVNHKRAFDAGSVKEALGLANFKLHRYKEAADLLASKRFNVQDLLRYYATVYPSADATTKIKAGERLLVDDVSCNALRCMELIDVQPGSEFARGTWWQAFNAITYATQHVFGRTPDTRMQSAWYGANQQKQLSALNLALEFAEAA